MCFTSEIPARLTLEAITPLTLSEIVYKGGSMCHLLTFGLRASQIHRSLGPALFSDHIIILFHYSVPEQNSALITHLCITVPP